MTTFKDLLKRGEPVIGVYVSSTDPTILEMIKGAGYDFVRLDYEHTLFDYSELRELIRTATLLDLPCQVRVSNFHDITKLLDFGATGIVVPDVNTLELAKEAVKHTKHYPIGERGMFPIAEMSNSPVLVPLREYLKEANDIVTLTVQVEDINAVSILDEIAAMDGIDMLASGNAIFRNRRASPGQTSDPRVLDMERLIIKKP
jgi:2-keto-3-deoxy-L-rhamnonate aldolase RhmA